MTLKTIIADDEVLARQKLHQLLADESDISIVGEGATALETIDLVQFTHPDLLFLDIQMPGMDAFDILSALASGPNGADLPRIIFTTAFNQYAVRAFEINAVDYLLKPYTRQRLKEAVQRARIQLAVPHENGVSASAAKKDPPYTTRIVFKSKGRILFLPVTDIRWVMAEENYMRICTERESHLLRETMAHLEARLDPASFIRVHRSTIVNLHYVKEIRTDTPGGEPFVLMRDGQKLPLSRGYRSRIAQLVGG
ncbi:MAG TPA: LytTR family DNA-binding domain-containing protein [Silvibacterium sp.]|nr:LytTR family DNA-binding domain-containing protein [Silvibacterium sp.]